MAPRKRTEVPKAWMPPVGSMISAYLPHEIIRAQVVKEINNETIQVKIVQPPLSKTHTYRYNQLVELHRVPNPPMGYRWESDE